MTSQGPRQYGAKRANCVLINLNSTAGHLRRFASMKSVFKSAKKKPSPVTKRTEVRAKFYIFSPILPMKFIAAIFSIANWPVIQRQSFLTYYFRGFNYLARVVCLGHWCQQFLCLQWSVYSLPVYILHLRLAGHAVDRGQCKYTSSLFRPPKIHEYSRRCQAAIELSSVALYCSVVTWPDNKAWSPLCSLWLL